MPALGQICHCCLKISLEKTLACKMGKLSLVATIISGSLINMAIEELEAHRKQKHHERLFSFSFFLLFDLQDTIKPCIPIANLLVLRITSGI